MEKALSKSVCQMVAEKGRVVVSQAIITRTKSSLSQLEFAKLLGVSVRILQKWEQGRERLGKHWHKVFALC